MELNKQNLSVLMSSIKELVNNRVVNKFENQDYNNGASYVIDVINEALQLENIDVSHVHALCNVSRARSQRTLLD